MKKFLYILALAALSLAACQSDAPEVADSDLVEVHFRLRGYYGAPFSPLDDNEDSRSEEDYPRDLEKFTPHQLPINSTVWVSIQHVGANAQTPGHASGEVKPFVVDANGMLYPCEVDDDGNCIRQINRPIYLSRNHEYSFKVMGPARKLTDDEMLYIENGQEVYAHDDRYPQTKPLESYVVTDFDVVDVVELNPLIQQTAKLKFTIKTKNYTYTGDEGTYEYSPIHTLEINESGIVITGLQEHYSQHNNNNVYDPVFEGNYAEGSTPWNWKWDKTYLLPFPGKVRNYLTLTAANATEMTNEKLVLETCILPCDATANPIIVGFYLNVNGVPTQFEMMLNRKMFLHGYQYHYLGTLDIQNGITVLEWQTITQHLGNENIVYVGEEEVVFAINGHRVDENGQYMTAPKAWEPSTPETFNVSRKEGEKEATAVGLDQFTINDSRVVYVADEAKNKLQLSNTAAPGYYIVKFHASDIQKTINIFQVDASGNLLYQDLNTAWEGNNTFDNDWENSGDDKLLMGASNEGVANAIWNNVAVGDRIHATITNVGSGAYAIYSINTTDWPKLIEYAPTVESGFDFTIPDTETLYRLKQYGLILYGVNFTVTKVTIQKNAAPVS